MGIHKKTRGAVAIWHILSKPILKLNSNLTNSYIAHISVVKSFWNRVESTYLLCTEFENDFTNVQLFH